MVNRTTPPTGRLRIAAMLTAATLTGAACAFGVQAQSKPLAYTVAEIDILDAAQFQAFAMKNAAGVAAAGGKFLALRGQVAAENGTAPQDVALIAWPSLADATRYFSSPGFKDLIPLRDKGANVRLYHVEGVPQ
jgi:uncharacterized protein (DUF1330 family)